ncbi:RdgB/HAM1 family non-canonical purine NTP pyrophosphatase [Salinarchaeum sp. Harcht-Bsk1]|uniref:non-canonical purine NTP pyrophosphatase n=1 Tax=Salinarchaeum sp. Harcht-Bsk1 TaxID=1333523 RepID=UPI0003424169|nr:non-canonical purine NTP pyrophosphatase [Salinarchaeum sp. Harcht-Bsk1]AGN02726.1 RdgB/HAM1 family non-canonical purine NTP pyrophosphatase [Salinarchaeum sp. Harcht-Bsk1]
MLRFVTGNEGKVEEAREYLPMAVEQTDYDYVEVQSDDLAPIAARGARESFRELGGTEPVAVEDSGLFVDALGGFPGPYSAYAEYTLGIERVYRLVEPEDDHRASFRSVVAYAADADSLDEDVTDDDPDWHDGVTVEDGVAVATFEGTVRGEIVTPRGDGGFGYDPIFEHEGRTMAERSTAEKNAISHRGRALAKLADWLAAQE